MGSFDIQPHSGKACPNHQNVNRRKRREQRFSFRSQFSPFPPVEFFGRRFTPSPLIVMLPIRLGFVLMLVGAAFFVPLRSLHASPLLQTSANEMAEWSLVSQKTYADPFNDIELDVIVTTPDSRRMKVPAFWVGGQTWRVRYASSLCGTHSFVTACSDKKNPSLDGIKG